MRRSWKLYRLGVVMDQELEGFRRQKELKGLQAEEGGIALQFNEHLISIAFNCHCTSWSFHCFSFTNKTKLKYHEFLRTTEFKQQL